MFQEQLLEAITRVITDALFPFSFRETKQN
jgi:hypothetical protein